MKYTKNNNYWKTPTVENSYWAGFIAADGNLTIQTRGAYVLRIGISESDRVLLDNFKAAIEYTGPISTAKKQIYVYKEGNKSNKPVGYTIHGKPSVHIQIAASQQYYDDLAKWFNITPKKTLTLQPPNITDEEMIKAYIVGLIDGDGHHNPRKKDRNRFRRVFKILGTEALLLWMRDQLTIPQIKVANDGAIFRLDFSNSTADRVYEYLLPTAIRVKALQRKWRYV